MQNVKFQREGDMLYIAVDLTQEHGLSTSKKNTIIATTSGMANLADTEVQIGLNVVKAYTPVPKAPKEPKPAKEPKAPKTPKATKEPKAEEPGLPHPEDLGAEELVLVEA